MVVGAKVCELTDGFLWFVCSLYVGILTSLLMHIFFSTNYNYSNICHLRISLHSRKNNNRPRSINNFLMRCL